MRGAWLFILVLVVTLFALGKGFQAVKQEKQDQFRMEASINSAVKETTNVCTNTSIKIVPAPSHSILEPVVVIAGLVIKPGEEIRYHLTVNDGQIHIMRSKKSWGYESSTVVERGSKTCPDPNR